MFVLVYGIKILPQVRSFIVTKDTIFDKIRDTSFGVENDVAKRKLSESSWDFDVFNQGGAIT